MKKLATIGVVLSFIFFSIFTLLGLADIAHYAVYFIWSLVFINLIYRIIIWFIK